MIKKGILKKRLSKSLKREQTYFSSETPKPTQTNSSLQIRGNSSHISPRPSLSPARLPADLKKDEIVNSRCRCNEAVGHYRELQGNKCLPNVYCPHDWAFAFHVFPRVLPVSVCESCQWMNILVGISQPSTDVKLSSWWPKWVVKALSKLPGRPLENPPWHKLRFG